MNTALIAILPVAVLLPALAAEPPAPIPDPPTDAEGIAALPKVHFRPGAAPFTCEQFSPATHRVAKADPITLGVYVGADGKVKATRILQSSGVADFDRAAQNCFRRARDIDPTGIQPGADGAWQSVHWTLTLR